MTGLDNVTENNDKGVSPFTRRVGLTTAVFAVILAVASLFGGNTTKDIMLAQQRASNMWAYYQAKTIRQHLYDSLTSIIELNLIERGRTMAPEARRKLEQRIAAMKAEVKRFKAEKAEIMTAARDFEKTLARSQTKDPYLDFSQILLQIAIILASISMIVGSGRFFIFALAMAGGGTVLLINGLFLFFRIPFLH